jgi:folate-binding protein YgfZ
MNQEWQTYLESSGATVDKQDRVRFVDAEGFPECALCDLSSLGLLQIGGADAADFLQGQFTNDIHAVTEQQSQLSGYCTPQGRLLANFRIFRREQDFFLQLPLELLPAFQKRLSMYILRAQVRIADLSDRLVRIGLAGECAAALLADRFPGLPDQPNAVLHPQEWTLLRLPGAVPRFEIIAPAGQMIPLWEHCRAQAAPADPDYWPLLEIRAGIPTVYTATVEAFVPQMINLHRVNGVSFSKGCYVGQEVVARMKYLGKLKRRMHLARVTCASAPLPGDELYADQTTQSGQGAGTVVDARPSGDGNWELLAVVEDASFGQGRLHLEDSNGPVLEFLELPYPAASEM